VRNKYLISLVIFIALPALSGCLEQTLEGKPSGGIDFTRSSVTALTSTVTADGSHSSVIEVLLKSSQGKPVSGVAISLVSSRDTADTIATINSTTDVEGRVLYSVASTTSGLAYFAAALVDENLVLDQAASVTFTAGPISESQSEIIVYPGTPELHLGTTVLLTLVARDAYGNALTSGGESVVFTRGTGVGESAGTISPSPATDNHNGTYSAIYTPTASGTQNLVNFEVAGRAGTNPVGITVLP
jgi:hypothetical protein